MKKNVNDYEKNKVDKFIDFMLLSLIPYVLIMCIIILISSKVNASSVTSHNLPFTETNITTYNTFFVDHNELWLQGVLSHYDVENIENCAIFIFERSENSASVLVRLCLITQEDVNNFVAYNSSNEIINISEFTDYTSDYFVLPTTINTYSWRYRKDNTDFSLYSSTPSRNSNLSFFGNHNINNYGMTFCYPIYIKGTLSIGNNIIITSLPNFIHNQGHATLPDTFESPVYTTGHIAPQNVPPTYTVNNYTWNTYTPPSVDNSTVESLLESLTDIVKYNAQYLTENLHNEFSNLLTNLHGFTQYIGNTIQYYGNLIVSNIQNGIQTFYNNMVSLFEPISNGIDFISQPLDVETCVTAIENTSVYTDIQGVNTLKTEAFGVFATVDEPQTFAIPLDLRSIDLLGQTQITYIDLGWLLSARTYIRAFMWVCVTFGLLYSIVIDIPSMLRSGAK